MTYIRHFLAGRKTRVEINGRRSDQFLMKQGLPQGSSISPILFVVFINDIDVDLDPQTTASLFADDTATWLKDGHPRGSNRQLAQTEVNKIVAWADTWKMSLNSDKTRTMITSTAPNDLLWNPDLKISNTPIKAVEEYKFLGTIISNNLRFTKHIDMIVTKCRKRINILKCLSTKNWGCALETQRRLYTQYIRSAIEYASSSFHGWISDTHMKRLQRVQNEAMRVMAGLAQTCPIDFLHLETGLEPLQLRFVKNDEITWDRYDRLPPNDPRNQLIKKQVDNRLSSRHGFRAKTSPTFPFKSITREVTTPHIEPWLCLENLCLESVQLEKNKECYTKDELKRLSTEKIDSLNKNTHIYTDGSTSSAQMKGGAGLYVETSDGTPLHEESRPAGSLCSSYTGECVALLMAIEWIESQPLPADYLICTDSKSLLEALRANAWTDPDPWLKQIKRKIADLKSTLTVLWLPSHCDVHGNERADRLADIGTRMDQTRVPVPHAIIKAKIRARTWKVTHPEAIKIYGERRSPRWEVEQAWPKSVRTLYARLRTGHSKELRDYTFIIDKDDDDTCLRCNMGMPETTRHVLCECPALSQARQKHADGKATVRMLVTDPETCRQILQERFEGLKLPETLQPETHPPTPPMQPTTLPSPTCVTIPQIPPPPPQGTEETQDNTRQADDQTADPAAEEDPPPASPPADPPPPISTPPATLQPAGTQTTPRPITPGSLITEVERRTLRDGEEQICDNIATAAMALLMQRNPLLTIQPTLLCQSPDLLQYSPDETIHVHHNGAGHFVTSSTVGATLRIYDSLNLTLTADLWTQLAALFSPDQRTRPHAQQVYMRYKQRGSTDCGLYAIAYAVDLAEGEDPSNIRYDQRRMRSHLDDAFRTGRITSFPRQRTLHAPPTSPPTRTSTKDPPSNATPSEATSSEAPDKSPPSVLSDNPENPEDLTHTAEVPSEPPEPPDPPDPQN